MTRPRFIASFHALRTVLTKTLLTAGLLIAWTPDAAAQGDSNKFFPDEITVDDLELYGQHLNLSDEQVIAARQFHRKYLERFSPLRDEKVAPHGWPTTPSETHAQFLELMERFQRDTEAIREDIRRIDRTLFTEIETILDESQVPAMQRVRDHRERRTVYVAKILGTTQRQFHDLSWLAREHAKLDAADAPLVEPILIPYERRLTNLLKRLHTAAFEMEYEPGREFVRRGHGDEPLGEADMDVWRAMNREVWETRGRKTIQIALDIDELNRTTSDRIVRTISPAGGDLWMDAFLGQSYQSASRPRRERRKLLDAIDRAEDLAAPDRVAFHELFLEIERVLLELERRWIEAEGGYRDRRPMIFGWPIEGEQWDVYHAANRELGDELTKRVDLFRNQVSATLSPGGWAAWDAAYGVITNRHRSTRPRHPSGASVLNVAYASIFMKARDLSRIKRAFALDQEQQAALHEAFEACKRACGVIEPDLPESPWNQYGYQSPLSREVRDRIRRADEMVFGALDRMLQGDADRERVNWFRNVRRRKLLGHGCTPRVAGGLDVTRFVLDNDLPPEDVNRVAEMLDEYDARSRPLFEQLYSSYRTQFEWYFDGNEEEVMTPHVRPWQEAQSAVTRLNVDTMLGIGERLESDEAKAMLDLFTRFCYGPVFEDSESAQPVLNRAKGLEDLTATQRDALLDLVVTHLEQYQQLTDAMLNDARYTLFWFLDDMRTSNRQSPTGREETESYRRHRFERDELNAASILQLRTILTPTQMESIE